MSKPIIRKIAAREILDSRGNPTVEVTVVLQDDTVGQASVPSGASTGKFEAHEKRDGEKTRYNGKGVLLAVGNITRTIAPALLDKNAGDQSEIDRLILNLDGTPNKTRLGANATLAVSLAVARAAAAFYHQPLYRYIGGVSAVRLPVPMMNILNGGAHAANNLDVQEFMIVPIGANNFAEGLRWGAEIYHVLGDILRRRALSTTVGDEGGYAPDLDSDEAALNLIAESIHEAGYDGRVKIALDIASSEWGNGSVYLLPKRKIRYTAAELIAYYQRLCERYPILSIEDGLGEEDYTGWREMTEVLGKNVMLVGDDLFVTNEARLLSGITGKQANAILIKPNQIGTLSETLQVIRTAKNAGYRYILSHRSGETEDTSIADLAVGTNAPFIKSGAPCRGERVAKYNRLLRIEGAVQGKSGGSIYAFPMPPPTRI